MKFSSSLHLWIPCKIDCIPLFTILIFRSRPLRLGVRASNSSTPTGSHLKDLLPLSAYFTSSNFYTPPPTLCTPQPRIPKVFAHCEYAFGKTLQRNKAGNNILGTIQKLQSSFWRTIALSNHIWSLPTVPWAKLISSSLHHTLAFNTLPSNCSFFLNTFESIRAFWINFSYCSLLPQKSQQLNTPVLPLPNLRVFVEFTVHSSFQFFPTTLLTVLHIPWLPH